MKRTVSALFLALVAGALPVTAGEYSKISFGLQVDFTSANTSKVPFQNSAGNIQGAEADKLFGVGLTTQVRFGELFSQRLSGLVLTPTLSFRMGTVNENQFYANMNFYSSDGSVTSIQNADSSRKTTTRQIALSLPVRYYFSGAASSGGFFVEGGPVAANVQQSVDLQVNGLILAIPSSVSESARITNTTSGFVVGLGTTGIYRQSQSTFILSFQSLSGTANRKSSSEIRGGFQWTF